MRKVQRSELVDYATWADDVRAQVQASVYAAKRVRRVHMQPCLTFLFENALTVRWQIQEMMRVERIVKETNIQHEVDTYNGLIGDDGQLGCVLLVEIEDEEERRKRLTEWAALPHHLYVELDDGERIPATFDDAQIDGEKLSSVQYLKFDTQHRVPIAVGCTLPQCRGHQTLDATTQAALNEDLHDSPSRNP